MSSLNGTRRSLKTLTAEVSDSLAAASLTDADAAMRALAERYAQLIDAAQDEYERFRIVTMNQAALLAAAASGELALELTDELRRLVKYLDAVKILAELGPKLQASLESLGASVRARAPRAERPNANSTNADGSSKKTGATHVPADQVGAAATPADVMAAYRAERARKQGVAS
jgi:hypothetical protein